MRDSEKFRKYAADCLRIANQMSGKDRQALLEIADAWETRAQSESTLMASFAEQMGNIEFLMVAIGSVVFFTLLLVTGNTMAISVRERTGELAVLKTVGLWTRSPRMVSGAAPACSSASAMASRTPKHMPRWAARRIRICNAK